MIQLNLFPEVEFVDEVIEVVEVINETTKDQACYIAANYLEDICLSDAVMQHLDQEEINEIAYVVKVLRS